MENNIAESKRTIKADIRIPTYEEALRKMLAHRRAGHYIRDQEVFIRELQSHLKNTGLFRMARMITISSQDLFYFAYLEWDQALKKMFALADEDRPAADEDEGPGNSIGCYFQIDGYRVDVIKSIFSHFNGVKQYQHDISLYMNLLCHLVTRANKLKGKSKSDFQSNFLPNELELRKGIAQKDLDKAEEFLGHKDIEWALNHPGTAKTKELQKTLKELIGNLGNYIIASPPGIELEQEPISVSVSEDEIEQMLDKIFCSDVNVDISSIDASGITDPDWPFRLNLFKAELKFRLNRILGRLGLKDVKHRDADLAYEVFSEHTGVFELARRITKEAQHLSLESYKLLDQARAGVISQAPFSQLTDSENKSPKVALQNAIKQQGSAVCCLELLKIFVEYLGGRKVNHQTLKKYNALSTVLEVKIRNGWQLFDYLRKIDELAGDLGPEPNKRFSILKPAMQNAQRAFWNFML